MQVTTKNIQKKDTSSALQALCVKGIFQIQPPISGANFLNNISLPHITWRNLGNFLTINLKDKSFLNSIEL